MLAEQLGITTTKERLEFTLFQIPSTPNDGKSEAVSLANLENKFILASSAELATRFD